MKDLTQCRAELDAIDSQLVALFEQRMRVSREVALYKHAHRLNILDASREDAVLQSRAAQATDDALRQPVVTLFREIMRLSREEQRRVLDAMTETQSASGTNVSGAPGENTAI